MLSLDVTGTMRIKDENMNGGCEWWQKGLYYRKRVCTGRGVAVERWGENGRKGENVVGLRSVCFLLNSSPCSDLHIA